MMNRVATVVSCLCGLGLVALLLFSVSRTRDTSYTDYTPPAGLRFANERPSREPSADKTAEQNKAQPIKASPSPESDTNRWHWSPSLAAGQPRPRMLFHDPLQQTEQRANRLPDPNGPRTPPSKETQNVHSGPAAALPGEEPAPPNAAPRLFGVPSPRMVTASEVEP
jgi:hypothetical protein